MSERLSKAFFGAEGDPTFDLDAARTAYQWVMERDYDEASMALRITVFDETARDLEKYGDFVRTEIAKQAKGRLDHVRKAVAKRHIANPSEETEALLVAIGKASSFIDPDLSVRAQRQWRSNDGRFRVMSTSIGYGRQRKPLSAAQAQRLNIPKPTAGGGTVKTVSLSREQTRDYQEAYSQIAQTLRRAREADPQAILQIHYEDGTPSKEILVNDETKIAEIIDGNQFKRNNKIDRVEVQSLRQMSPTREDAFDVMGAMRVPSNMAGAIAGANVPTESLSTFSDKWTRTGVDGRNLIANPSERAYRRLSASSEFLDSLLPEDSQRSGLQRKLALAFGAGKWAGKYGTEIEQVIGPSVRRSSYRYRGTEKKPDPGIQNTINAAITRNRGDLNQARSEMIYGRKDLVATRNGTAEDYKESPIISYFLGRLPKAELSRLQNKSGVTPPSQGVIIDRSGQVATEAVGYGDDWYLPFDLKNLGRMRGGEYIRTRTYGGPSTEDIYAGMVGGARAMTVVSRSGVFTIEFDDTFRGSRRYNDNAARMVKRYGMLLDAVKNGEITLDEVPQDRMKELYEEANYEVGEGPEFEDRRRSWVNNQLKDFQVRRQMSAERKSKATEEFLQDKFSASNDDWETQVAERVKRETADELRQDQMFQNINSVANGKRPAPMGTDSEDARSMVVELARKKQSEVAARYSTPAAAAERMFPGEFKRFADARQRDYEANLRQLSLDGDGYAKALEALQEQFPYYIKSINFRHLSEGKDTGYVKPYYVRPEAALIGYYDESINGRADVPIQGRISGKMTADRAFYQNSSRAFLNPNSREQRVPTKSTEEKPADGQKAPAPQASMSDYAREEKSVGDLISHARERGWNAEFGSKFGADEALARFPLLTGQMSEKELTDYVMESNVNRAKLDRELANIATTVASDKKNLEDRFVLDLDSAIKDAYQKRGAVPEETAYDIVSFLRDSKSKRVYDFGTKYRDGMSSRDYEKTFDTDVTIQQAKKMTGIEEIDQIDFDERINRAISVVRDQLIKIERAERSPSAPPRDLPKRQNVENIAQGLSKLQQLNRYYLESVGAYDEAREAAYGVPGVPSPAPKPGTVSFTNPMAITDSSGTEYDVVFGRGSQKDIDEIIRRAAGSSK